MLTTRSNAHCVQAKVDKQSMTQTPNLRLSRLLGCCNLVHLHMQWPYLLLANLLHSHLLLLPYLNFLLLLPYLNFLPYLTPPAVALPQLPVCPTSTSFPSPNFLHSHLLLSMMRPPDVFRAPVHPS